MFFLVLVSGCAHQTRHSISDLMQAGSELIESSCPERETTVTTESLTNRYDPTVVDTIKTTRCDGVEMAIYVSKFASNPNGLAMHVNVTKPLPQIPSYF